MKRAVLIMFPGVVDLAIPDGNSSAVSRLIPGRFRETGTKARAARRAATISRMTDLAAPSTLARLARDRCVRRLAGVGHRREAAHLGEDREDRITKSARDSINS